MVDARLCQTARPTFFSARPRFFVVFGLRDWDLDPTVALREIRDCETFRTAQKLKKKRLRDPWNLSKILRDLYFFRDDSPPLIFVSQLRSSRILCLSGHLQKLYLLCFLKIRYLCSSQGLLWSNFSVAIIIMEQPANLQKQKHNKIYWNLPMTTDKCDILTCLKCHLLFLEKSA